MCGICGLIKKEGYIDYSDINLIEKIISTNYHRGPDDNGIWISKNKKCILGHNRLSIIDIEKNKQPFVYDDYSITYNGEIYNFKDLKNDYIKDYSFKSNGDTEVLLYFMINNGLNDLTKLNGMFSFGFYDSKENKVILARDFFGIKPLYFLDNSKHFLFSSEINPLLEFNDSINESSIIEYLMYGYIPCPKTIIKDIAKLDKASYLIYDIDRNKYIINKYWEPKFNYLNYTSKSVDFHVEALEDALYKSVNKHLVSDVPVSSFLSGGLDSALLAVNINKIKKVNYYTAIFNNSKFDEIINVDELLGKFNLNHYYLTITENTRNKEFQDRISETFGEPFSDSSAIPAFLICQAMSKYSKVAISGDGGDEIFGGYLRYIDLLRFYKKDIYKLNNLLKIFLVKISNSFFKKDYLLSKSDYYQNSVTIFNKYELKNLINNFENIICESRIFYIKDYFDKFFNIYNNILDAAQLTDINTYLPEDNLTKIDRVSMANSLEVRVPFLSIDIWNVAKNIPPHYRISNYLKTKFVLRKLAEREISVRYSNFTKKGFAYPFTNFLNNKLKEEFKKIYSNSEPSKYYINEIYFDKLLKMDIRSPRYSRKLFSLYQLILWLNRFYKK